MELMEHGENKFEKYLPYIGGYEVSKEDLRKQFDHFLEHPEYYGHFIVMWKENDTMENRFSLKEIVEQIYTKVEGE